MGLLLLTVMMLCLIGCVPGWPHSAGFGYRPGGVLALLVLLLLIAILLGYIPFLAVSRIN